MAPENAAALASLVGDLYRQLTAAQLENAQLRQALVEALQPAQDTGGDQ